MIKLVLQNLITVSAAQLAAASNVLDNVNPRSFGGRQIKSVVLTLNMVLADRTNADETYNFYVTTYHLLPSGAYSRWDVCAFPQIAATGPLRYTMICTGQGVYPYSVTTADPGVAAVLSGSLATYTAGAGHGIRTATAGMAYHGTLGEGLAYSLVSGGSTPGPITYEISAICHLM